jgi:hypothetical protein
MTTNRTKLLLAAVLLAVVASVGTPLAIRGGIHYFALRKVLTWPNARARLAVTPVRRTFTGYTPVHPVNLGYATFDTGSTKPLFIEARAANSLVLTNHDVWMAFLPPFGPMKLANSVSANVSATERTRHPHMAVVVAEWKTNPITMSMAEEEAQILPLSKTVFMSKDDYLLYSLELAMKAGNRLGSGGVQFFESPTVKGIVWIGADTNDVRSAAVSLASFDGTRNVGLHFELRGTSSTNLSPLLDAIIRSFRFTEKVDEPEAVKAMIRAAGIPQRKDPPAKE